ncbi:hypothetical protein [Sphingobacterium sp. LRF_L2]|uniref:hypothetical protein n=1 Tax=Sphingobacterium sp. LRF_L2 TaxID=3369421 RepID=UPI003F5F95D3
MRIISLSIILYFFCSIGHAQSSFETDQDKDIAVIQSFLKDIANTSTRPDVILSQHVLIENTNTDEAYDYLEASIDEIRLNLQSKKLTDIECIPFSSLSRNLTRDIDPEGKPTSKMYFLYYKKRQIFAVYIAMHKIASFTLVAKGNQMAHFVTY